MDTTWLEDFLCLARTLNFTRAAEERNVTQSAFSRRIKSLEIWLGIALLDRSSYPVRLSPAGEDFLPVAKSVVLQLLQARDDLRASDRGGMKFFGFAAPHSISINHLAPYLRQLEETLPAIRTRVMSDNLHSCCQLLSEGACDFLLCYRHRHIALALDEQRFARLDLGTENLIPVCVPDRAGGPAWRLPGRAAARIPQLAYARGSFLAAVVEHKLKTKPAFLDLRHMDAFAEALKSQALQGTGVAWLPERSVRGALERGELVPAGDDSWAEPLTLSIFADSDGLDEAGSRIWDFFLQARARHRDST